MMVLPDGRCSFQDTDNFRYMVAVSMSNNNITTRKRLSSPHPTRNTKQNHRAHHQAHLKPNLHPISNSFITDLFPRLPASTLVLICPKVENTTGREFHASNYSSSGIWQGLMNGAKTEKR
jgi:hypothetical protein